MKLFRAWHGLALASTVITTLALAGAASAQDKVQLTFRQFDPPTEIGGLVTAVDAWNASHPNIQVKLETMGGGDTLAQLAREVPAGAGPDVQQMAFVWTRDLARSKLVLDLDPLIAADPPGAGIGDFLATDLATLDGKIYGLPWSADTFSMAYRPDLLAAAGIKSFPDSWDDLATASKALTDTAKGQYGFCFPAGSAPDGGMWILANYYLWSNGKTLLEETSPGVWKLGVTAADIAGAMTYFNAYFANGLTPDSLITVNSWGDPELVGGLGRGDCAITFFPPQTFRAAQGQSEQPLLTAPIPKGSVKRISHLGGRALGINANTKHPKEAWEFVRYLVGPETFKTYNQYPAQKSLLASLNFPAAEQGYVDMLPLAQTFERYISSPLQVSTMTALINREFGAVYSGQRSPDEAAANVIKELEDGLKAAAKG
ncbi:MULTISPECIES: ABC transporter substrate-binding protein [unclassified Devosia]|uniref:ABC transporter substrate-binding protein n=1 Tax=unclassified Devosia TaxID=196773 RepID=UPI000A86EC5D|nr:MULTISPECIES: sugar ABC transporter substrate-binding protein [unclassified Devosia]MBN9306700.1 sugar ABC transporter substrate-binding protein [Devosia sp.]